MKYLTLLAGLIFLLLADSYSQAYKPVLTVDTIQWNYLSDMGCGDCFYTAQTKAYGDTVLNELHYKLVYHKKEYQNYELIGFIREDTVAGKLILLSYSYKCQDYPCYENTVYDMSLEVGDTLEFYSDWSTAYLKVTRIDTVEGKKTITFDGDNLAFIEGVGATRELTLFGFQNTGLSELLCKFHDGHIEFHRIVWEFDTCYVPFTGTGIEDKSTEVAEVFPNPADLNQTIKFESINNQDALLKIYSATGSLLFARDFTGSISITPGVFTEIGGIFIYQVQHLDSLSPRSGILIIE